MDINIDPDSSWVTDPDMVLVRSPDQDVTMDLVGNAGHSIRLAPSSCVVLKHHHGLRQWPGHPYSPQWQQEPQEEGGGGEDDDDDDYDNDSNKTEEAEDTKKLAVNTTLSFPITCNEG
ncbi:hypothetical protein STEG23_018328 [Scotinomys teguina]